MEWNKQTQQWAVAAGVIIIVAVAGWWLFMSKSDSAMQSGTEKTSDEVSEEATNDTSSGSTTNERPVVGASVGEEIQVNDQPAGDSVRVIEARLSRVSWVAVRDDLRIYGAARVNPPVGGGTVTDIAVPLLRNTEAGTMYKVVVYADDGDSIFDFTKDALVEGLGDSFTALNGD